MADNSILSYLKVKEPWDTWKGFLLYCLQIFIISITSLGTIHAIIKLSLFYFFIFLSAPLVIFLIIFAIRRTWLKLIVSNRANIIIAYNLEGLNYQAFSKKYSQFIETLQNKIYEHDLGKNIKIISKPIDVHFKTFTAAEAKTKLSLLGSTLLIWGHEVKKKSGIKFETRFSYEFGYPKGWQEEYCKKIFSKNIQKGLSGGLFAIDRLTFDIDADEFSESTLSTSLFILGLMSASLGLIKKAIYFFEEFRKIYYESPILRRREMGPAFIIANENLIKFYRELCVVCYRKKDMGLYAKKILEIDENNYYGNISYACFSEIEGNRDNAVIFTNKAETNAPRSAYAHIFNYAYFALSDGKYKESFQFYESIPPECDNTTNISQIREFLCEAYNKSGELSFLFAEGYVASKWQLELSTLQDFINRVNASKQREKYVFLIEKAEDIVRHNK